MFLINIAPINVCSILPEQVVGGCRFSIDLLQSGLPDVNENVIQRDQIIPASHTILVISYGVIDHVNTLGNISAFIIFFRIPIAHASNRSHSIGDDQILLDTDDTVRTIRVVDNLDAIFAIAGNDIVADDNMKHGAAIFMKTNLTLSVMVTSVA